MDFQASDLMLKTMDYKSSERERAHLPEKCSSSKHSSDHIVFREEEEKNPYSPCRVWEKSFFALSSGLL